MSATATRATERTCPLCSAPFPLGRATCPSCHAEAATAFTADPGVVRETRAKARRAVLIAALVYAIAIAIAWWLGR